MFTLENLETMERHKEGKTNHLESHQPEKQYAVFVYFFLEI